MSEKHWLVKHAEEDPLGGIFDSIERRIDSLFIGAVIQTAKSAGDLSPSRSISQLQKLVAALEESEKIIERRHDAAAQAVKESIADQLEPAAR